MKAVILAAGEGVRMHPLTQTRPKVMLPLANKPLLEHVVLEARAAGIQDFIFVIGYQAQTIEAYFQDGAPWGIHIEYASQRRQLGTAHALTTLPDMLGDRFLLLNGDSLVKAQDIARVVASPGITMGAMEREDPRHLGVVEVEGDRVVRIHEKVPLPPSRLANVGLYLFTRDIFPAVFRTQKSPRGEYELTDSLQILIDQGTPVRYQRIEYWLELSYPWDMLSANETLLAELEPQNLGEVEPGATLKGPVSIGKNSVVRAGAYVVGPVIIGAECDIGPNCLIRPSTAIGDHCHIGHAVEIKNSIIMAGSKIPHHNYVGDSIIGQDCNLGAGTKIANLRLDKQAVEVLGTATGRVKFGAILGDGVQTGINVSINVGSLIGSYTFLGPGAIASGQIEPGSRIF